MITVPLTNNNHQRFIISYRLLLDGCPNKFLDLIADWEKRNRHDVTDFPISIWKAFRGKQEKLRTFQMRKTLMLALHGHTLCWCCAAVLRIPGLPIEV